MEIGGLHTSYDHKRLAWPIHSRHILVPNLHERCHGRRMPHGGGVNLDLNLRDAIEKDDVNLFRKHCSAEKINAVARPKCEMPMHHVALNNSVKVAKLLISMGGNVNHKDTSGRTPLFYGVEKNNCEVVEVLLNDGLAAIQLTDPKTNGDSVLHRACINGAVESATLLLTHNADVNARNNTYSTPLISVCKALDKKTRSTGPALVKLLLENGANVNHADGWDLSSSGDPIGGGKTALHHAAHNDSAEVVALLLERGADGGIRDFYGERAFTYAKPNSKCRDLLRSKTTVPVATESTGDTSSNA
eukprot:m.403211 g.403211  ORF g.403211 m.403211 type:complete len:303 (-) comp21191_c1_seq27:2195-3103(-)